MCTDLEEMDQYSHVLEDCILLWYLSPFYYWLSGCYEVNGFYYMLLAP